MGLLDRWQTMNSLGGQGMPQMNRPMLPIDPLTGQPAQPRLPTPQPNMDMPWGDGQAMGNLYGQQQPKPQAPKPQMPGIRPMGPPDIRPQARDMGPPSAPQPPSMGMQEVGPQDASYAAYNPAAPTVEKQPQPGDSITSPDAAGQPEKKTDKIFGDFNQMDLLQVGLSLLGNSQNGGDWGAVGKDLGQIQQGIVAREDRALSQEDRLREIERQKKADARQLVTDQQQDTMFGFNVEEAKASVQDRARIIEERGRLAGARTKAVESTQDPALRAVLEGMTDEGYGAFLGNTYLNQQEQKARADADASQRAFQASQSTLDRQASLDAARLRNPSETARGRSDLALLAPWQEAAGLAQTYTLKRVQRMKQIMTELSAMGGWNNPLDADTRVTLSRLTGTNPQAQGLLQEYKNLLGQFTRDEAQKVKPVSNLDMEGIEKQMASGDTEVAGGYRILDRMEREMNEGIERTNAMVNWFDSGNSFSGRNPEGKTFFETFGFKPLDAPASASPTAQAGVGPKQTTAQPPSNAVIMLKQDPSPTKRKQFDDIFGPGAADRALGTKPVRPDASYSFGGY